MSGVIIARYDDRDLDAVIAVFQRSVREIAAADYNPAQIEAWSRVDHSAWAAPLLDRERWVARFGADIVGFVDLGGDGHLVMLYAHPAHRRSGVARRLLRQVETTAIALGLNALRAEVSLTARPFFEAQGFHVLEAETVIRNEQPFRRFRMRKEGLRRVEPEIDDRRAVGDPADGDEINA